MLLGALGGDQQLESVLRRHGDAVGPWVSTMAELFVNIAFDESEFTRAIMEQEAHARPERWRQPLRTAIEHGSRRSKVRAASLLELVGQTHDVRRLREFAKQSKGTAFVGRGLARRVADRARIADLGRVTILIGNRSVGGDRVRRKVLALLCYLITRPGMAAARDQVVDALWPDQDPVAAANSLNQTVYFLRREFEPRYVDDLSPGYLRHETDLIWLDSELISSDSDACRGAIEAARKSTSWASVDLVSRSYSGRFALDFEYEEWATGYRDNLHASYLAIIEEAVSEDILAARFDRGIELCRRALDVDPSCEPIERQLLTLYRLTGSRAAAEEQYRHYAAALKDDLGLTAPPLSEI
jgi:DNA-binding SARP family transcriptional activator